MKKHCNDKFLLPVAIILHVLVESITGAPKLINSDLFLKKRATVPIKSIL